MKITREEFNELVVLHKENNKTVEKYQAALSDNAIEQLAYPVLEWIIKKLDIDEWFYDFCSDGDIIICDYIDENGFPVNPVHLSDLDVIYDMFLNKEN